MKLYVLYFSPSGGTKKVSGLICSAWDCQKEYISLPDIPKRMPKTARPAVLKSCRRALADYTSNLDTSAAFSRPDAKYCQDLYR